jgi:hypothetical protein
LGDIGDITDVAERLRLVREARRKFMRMWAVDRSMIDPLVDRLAADLDEVAAAPPHPRAPLVDES